MWSSGVCLATHTQGENSIHRDEAVALPRVCTLSDLAEVIDSHEVLVRRLELESNSLHTLLDGCAGEHLANLTVGALHKSHTHKCAVCLLE